MPFTDLFSGSKIIQLEMLRDIYLKIKLNTDNNNSLLNLLLLHNEIKRHVKYYFIVE